MRRAAWHIHSFAQENCIDYYFRSPGLLLSKLASVCPKRVGRLSRGSRPIWASMGSRSTLAATDMRRPPRGRRTGSVAFSALLIAMCGLLACSGGARAQDWGTSGADLQLERPPYLSPQGLLPNGGGSRLITPFTLVPASHPAVLLPSRWVVPQPTAAEETPLMTSTAFNASLVDRYAAKGLWCTLTAKFRFTGSRSLAVHFAGPGAPPVAFYYRLDGNASWSRTPAFVYSMTLEADLDPTKEHDIFLLVPWACYFNSDNTSVVGVRFVGFGLDPPRNGISPKATLSRNSNGAEWAAKQSIPGQPVVEFVGDSITATLLPGWENNASALTLVELLAGGKEKAALLKRKWPRALNYTPRGEVPADQMGSIAFRACDVAGCSVSMLADFGLELLDYPPPVRSRLKGKAGKPGMEWVYFQEYIPPKNEPRTVRPFNFGSQRHYAPAAIVINIGTNDNIANRYKPRANLEREFIRAYMALIHGIRRVYGNATKIVVMVPCGRATLLLPSDSTTSRAVSRTPTRRGRKTSTTRTSVTFSPSSSKTRVRRTRTSTTTKFRKTRTSGSSLITLKKPWRRESENGPVEIGESQFEARGVINWWQHGTTTRTRTSSPTQTTTTTKSKRVKTSSTTRTFSTTTTVVPITKPMWNISPPFSVDIYSFIVQRFHRAGDANVYLLNTTGWITKDNVEALFIDRLHPTFDGGRVIGAKVGDFLRAIGVGAKRRSVELGPLEQFV